MLQIFIKMALNLEEVKQNLTPWVKESLKKEDLKDVEITVTGTSDKGDNYMGDIIFLDVNGVDKLGEKKTIFLVIKKGKANKTMREEWNSKMIYVRENTIYDTIFPAFTKFQHEKNIKEIFNSVPKCYGTLEEDEVEAILLENLKMKGYELHDRFINMNVEHIKFVLYQYAKFHAISFAMRDQQKEKFDELTESFEYLLKKSLMDGKMSIWYNENVEKATKILKEIDPAVAEKFEKKVETGLVNMMLQFDIPIEECVVTHGDCWNNNFMFLYEDESKKCPSKVAILDWQLSIIHSPVVDLSYFLYIVSSKKEISKFDELLHYYHDNLCSNIRELGSDPEKLFPFSKLVEHWEKYSIYGVSMLVTSLKIMMCDKENAVDMGEFQNSNDAFRAWNNVKTKNYNLYSERLFASLKHYSEGIKV